ncbi:MAG TPA: hypothetical protein V6D04_13085, partial [Candidatus Obscuribacterales bacterium]
PATTELLELEDWGGETTSQPTAALAATTEPEAETDDLYASLFGEDDVAGGAEPTNLEIPVASVESSTPAIADLAASFDLEETSDLTDAVLEPEAAAAQQSQGSPQVSSESNDLFEELADLTPETTTDSLLTSETPFSSDTGAGVQSDLTGTTLADFLFADAEPITPVAPEPASDEPNFNEPSEAIADPRAALVPPKATASSPATDPAALNLEDFQSSFTDEPDQADSLVELAELLDNAEVVETQPAAASASTSFSDFDAQPGTEESETENERLLSELSLQDIPNLGGNSTANSLEDAYVPAAPEEYLIAIEDDLGDETEAGLWLDDNIVQQLNEDLFTLEGPNTFASPPAAFAPNPPR